MISEQKKSRKRRLDREVYEDRKKALDAPEELGSPFFVRMPSGEVRYIRAGSNSAAVYEVFRFFGGSVRSCRRGAGDPGEALDTILAMPEEERKKLMQKLQASVKK